MIYFLTSIAMYRLFNSSSYRSINFMIANIKVKSMKFHLRKNHGQLIGLSMHLVERARIKLYLFFYISAIMMPFREMF
jgi:hypothetical protein